MEGRIFSLTLEISFSAHNVLLQKQSVYMVIHRVFIEIVFRTTKGWILLTNLIWGVFLQDVRNSSLPAWISAVEKCQTGYQSVSLISHVLFCRGGEAGGSHCVW